MFLLKKRVFYRIHVGIIARGLPGLNRKFSSKINNYDFKKGKIWLLGKSTITDPIVFKS